jgi:hypothetical protein
MALIRISAPIFGIALAPYWGLIGATRIISFPSAPPSLPNLTRWLGGTWCSRSVQVTRTSTGFTTGDIDASKIVWARDLGPEKNQELIDYYKGQTVWLLDPSGRQPRLLPDPLTFHPHGPHLRAIRDTPR